MLCSCHLQPPKEEQPQDTATPVLTPLSFSQLQGWKQDHVTEAFETFLKSCAVILKKPADAPFKPRGTYGDWQPLCNEAMIISARSDAAQANWFETRFQPYAVDSSAGDKDGLFTGYYEPSLNGALQRDARYKTPLYAMPSDLVTADLGLWGEEWAGRKITGRIQDGALVRYPDRRNIEANGLNASEVIVWVDDPVDAFFLHIQGSGRVALKEGGEMRVGYAGQNGHEYFAIGRELIARGALTKENVSLQTIRAWMAQNPDQAQSLMAMNPSYIFFRKLDKDGAVGAEGTVLTAQRSLAVDRSLYSYGLPVWLETEAPVPGAAPLRRLMIAQDTGGAIKGVIRGDVFWGFGPAAEHYAGHMKARGKFVVLLPKKLGETHANRLP